MQSFLVQFERTGTWDILGLALVGQLLVVIHIIVRAVRVVDYPASSDVVMSALFRNPHLLPSVVVDAAGMQHKVTEGFKAQDDSSFYPAEFNVVDIATCDNLRGINGMFRNLVGKPVLPTNKLKDQL
jgi:hypothetical protein